MVRVGDVVVVASGCQVHPGLAQPPNLDGGVGDFEQQPAPIFQRSAVVVGPPVRFAVEERVEQAAVGAVDFDRVE